jgi:ethanolamine ammonia-lyase large subunit
VKGEINEKTCDCHYEDVIGYIRRIKGGFDQTFYKQVIGASNVFKEGDQAIGMGAEDEATRQ